MNLNINFIKENNLKPLLSLGSEGKLFNNLSNLMSSLLVSEEYLSNLMFLISLKYCVWSVIKPKIEIYFNFKESTSHLFLKVN